MKNNDHKIDRIVSNAIENYEANGASDWNEFNKNYSHSQNGKLSFMKKGFWGMLLLSGISAGIYYGASLMSDTEEKIAIGNNDREVLNHNEESSLLSNFTMEKESVNLIENKSIRSKTRNEADNLKEPFASSSSLANPKKDVSQTTPADETKPVVTEGEIKSDLVNNYSINEIAVTPAFEKDILITTYNSDVKTDEKESNVSLTATNSSIERSKVNEFQDEFLTASAAENTAIFEVKANSGLLPKESTNGHTEIQKEEVASYKDSLNSKDSNLSKWRIGEWGSIDYVKDYGEWYTFETPEGENLSMAHASDYYGYSAGLKISRELSKKWILQTGIALSFSENTHRGSFTQTDSSNFVTVSYSYKPRYLNVPITLGYRLINKKITLCPYLGLSTRIFTGDYTNTINYSSPSYYTNISPNERKLYTDLFLNIEINYALPKNFSLTIEPIIKRSINFYSSFSKYSSYSLAAGINYRF